MISTDENIFKEGSEVRNRMFEYGRLVEELHIVVLTARNFQFPISNFQTNSKSQISKNTFVYPAFSNFKPLCLFSAYRIAKKIIGHWPLIIDHCVITCQDPFETGIVGYFLKKKFSARGGSALGGKISLQIQIHTDFLSPYFGRESLKNKIRVLLAKKIIPSADGIRVVSKRVRSSLITYFPNIPISKISVLPLFYDMWRFTDGAPNFDLHDKYPNHNFIILSASRLSKEKNVVMAVRAMKKVINKHPRALLLVVGSGPKLDSLKFQVKRYKLQDNVVFESWTKDIISYYKTSDVFVLTSNYEGGARTPVEAISSGLPVIMTDVPPAGELITDDFNGFIVNVDDADKMSEKIIELISNKDKHLKFKENSLRMAEGFITKEAYLKLYYKALVDATASANA